MSLLWRSENVFRVAECHATFQQCWLIVALRHVWATMPDCKKDRFRYLKLEWFLCADLFPFGREKRIIENMSEKPVPPATCPVCRTPLNRFRVAMLTGRRPNIVCRNCGSKLRPSPVLHRIASMLSLVIFFGSLFVIIRVARFIIPLRIVLILGVGAMIMAFYSSFISFERDV